MMPSSDSNSQSSKFRIAVLDECKSLMADAFDVLKRFNKCSSISSSTDRLFLLRCLIGFCVLPVFLRAVTFCANPGERDAGRCVENMMLSSKCATCKNPITTQDTSMTFSQNMTLNRSWTDFWEAICMNNSDDCGQQQRHALVIVVYHKCWNH
jgi:hypothetical protein